ncbi:MAG: DNA-directed RNA polymerase subunit beta' [Actinobacteria bacterium]|nr:DNA-directed RNA polymerase subunit beta' [Actinomycetota bacterium]
MIDINEFDAIRIGLASPEQIRAWSSGEVTKPETINYRTLKPEKDGLFCERIFGPTKDWECYCGKYKRVRYKGIICERCGVEVTRAKVRRERMGHIDLAAPVSHIWYFKGVPSRMGYLLDISPKQLERVLYFSASIVTFVDDEKRQRDMDKLEELVQADIDNTFASRDEQKVKIMAERDKRVAVLLGNSTPDEDDEIALGFDQNPLNEWTQEEMEKRASELRIEADTRLRDLERYADHQAARLRELWTQFKQIKKSEIITDETLFREMKEKFGSPFGYGVYFRGGMGAEAIRELLAAVDLETEAKNLRETIKTSKGQKLSRAVKRLKVVEGFLRSDNKPEWMILRCIPVIPPELRPMVQLDGGRFATSDLNDLYRRVINRNNRLKRLLDLGAPEIIVNNEKRMLQEAVDALFDNGRRGRAVTGPGNRPLKSLSDMLKGKQGRFRQNLLGKRVDYSGRSVIVAGPELKLHQCGIPKTMALELFKPFVMSRLVERKQVQNIKAAKKLVESEFPEVWDILDEVIAEHPVMLNRAPTLHRLGIQAFEPVLIEGKAIQLHPLVCTAFNADFDGDQMAVHLPLSVEAQAEARILMLSSNNILSPAHGRPIAVPTQDMILGCYYLTYFEGPDLATIDPYDAKALEALEPKPRPFGSVAELEHAYAEKSIGIQDPVLFRWETRRVLTTVGRAFFNSAVAAALEDYFGEEWDNEGPEGTLRRSDYEFQNRVFTKSEMSIFVSDLVEYYGSIAVARLLDVLKDLGFQYASVAGVTISKNDIVVPPDKEEILEGYEDRVRGIHEAYNQGEMTDSERRERVTDLWSDATEEVAAAMEKNFRRLNPVYMMASSGARGSFKQIRQLAGMRGLMASPKGEIIERPIKANFMEGLGVLEYFISTHGARKGLADTALRTADSGYLTRRLVDVAQEVVIRERDCGTEKYIEIPLRKSERLNELLLGRVLAVSVADPATGEVVYERNELLNKRMLEKLLWLYPVDDYADLNLKVRSVLGCQSEIGVCQYCYGRSLAANDLVAIGEAVGHIAAQSIGEPGTQLTMRTFHTGGVAGADITHGLPRVVELFEARKPKGQAKITQFAGTVHIEESDKAKKVAILDDAGEELHSYTISRRAALMVEEGQHVEAGDQLYEGSLNPHELLKYRGTLETARYIVSEVQEVYRKQGVQIDDKHVELIVRQMTKKVLVETPGDTSFLPGRMVDKLIFDQENERVAEAGGEPATYEEIILGITKASLATESFLSAASFQETTKVLTDAALEGKVDELRGLKENVIIGKLIPAATGLRAYRSIELVSTGIPAEMDIFGDVMGVRPDAGLGLTPEQQWAALTGSGRSTETYNMLVDDLELPTYVHSVLSRAGIERVNDLLSHGAKDLLAVPGLGQKSLEEIQARLDERGWALSGEEQGDGEADELLGTGDGAGDEAETALLGGDLLGEDA